MAYSQSAENLITTYTAKMKQYKINTPEYIVLRTFIDIHAVESLVLESTMTQKVQIKDLVHYLYRLRKYTLSDIYDAFGKVNIIDLLDKKVTYHNFINKFLAQRFELLREIRMLIEQEINFNIGATMFDRDQWEQIHGPDYAIDYDILAEMIDQHIPVEQRKNDIIKRITKITTTHVELELLIDNMLASITIEDYYTDEFHKPYNEPKINGLYLYEYMRRFAFYTRSQEIARESIDIIAFDGRMKAFHGEKILLHSVGYLGQKIIEKLENMRSIHADILEHFIIEQVGVIFRKEHFHLILLEDHDNLDHDKDVLVLRDMIFSIILQHIPAININNTEGFYKDYTGRFDWNDWIHREKMEMAAEYSDLDKMKMMLRKLSKHKDFFRYQFNKFSVSYHEKRFEVLSHNFTLTDLLKKYKHKSSEKIKDTIDIHKTMMQESMDKATSLLHKRNKLVVMSYDYEESKEKLSVLKHHKDMLQKQSTFLKEITL